MKTGITKHEIYGVLNFKTPKSIDQVAEMPGAPQLLATHLVYETQILGVNYRQHNATRLIRDRETVSQFNPTIPCEHSTKELKIPAAGPPSNLMRFKWPEQLTIFKSPYFF